MKEWFDAFYVQLVEFMPKILSGGLIYFAFWVGSRIARGIIVQSGYRTKFDPAVVSLMGRVVQVSILIFGAVTALGTLGVNIGALVAGLGLGGFAVGLAMKDSLSNLWAGITILMHRPFRVGQKISVAGFEGKVADINLRYTVLDTENNQILIPNANLLTNSIIILEHHVSRAGIHRIKKYPPV